MGHGMGSPRGHLTALAESTSVSAPQEPPPAGMSPPEIERRTPRRADYAALELEDAAGVSTPPLASHPSALAAIFRKISWRLLPIFFLLNCLNYLDRTNLAFASIQMSRDLGLSPTVYGIGSGIFFLSYSVCQIPSQMILRRVGAPLWLGIIVTSWGIVATCLAAVTNSASFYVVRFLLGAAESGSFPGYWYYLTKFYPDKHITLPYSITDSAIMVAQVVGAPLAAGLLHMDGVWGVRGWQWLFIIEGIPTAALGVTLYFLLPRRPAAARWLGPHEAAAVQREVDACRGHGSAVQESNGTLLLSALCNGRLWHIGVIKFMKDMTVYGTMFWAPLLIRSMLKSRDAGERDCDAWKGGEGAEGSTDTGYVEVLLTGIPFSLSAVLSVAVAWNSQRTKERIRHIGIPYILAGVMCSCIPLASKLGAAPGVMFLTGTIALTLCPNGCLLSLASAIGQGPAMSINLALYNSIANMSGMVGPLLFGVILQHTCSYSAAFVLLGVLLAIGGLLALCLSDPASSGLDPAPTSNSTDRKALVDGYLSSL